jgi:hypothetical protein
MSLLRLLNVQGIAGMAVSLALGILLLVQKAETSHWKKQSGQFEQLYRQQQSALTQTVSSYRAAAEQARAADRANLARVASQQRSINERTSNEYEARLAAARLSAQRLRREAAAAAADPRTGGAAPVPRLSTAAGGPAQASAQDGFPDSDREIATEQAIQLDELIRWVRMQAALSVNGGSAAAVDSPRR